MTNELNCVLKKVEEVDGVYCLELGNQGDLFYAVLLHNGYKVNENVTLVFKETDVIIAKEIYPELISTLNIHKGKIESIEKGKILSRINFTYKDFRMSALITTKSVIRLNIKEGEDIFWFLKALHVEVK